MNSWNLEISDEVRSLMEKAVYRHPHLKNLVESRLQALLAFPPDRWFRVHRKSQPVCFVPEPGQKVRLSGWVDFKARRIWITRFSLHS